MAKKKPNNDWKSNRPRSRKVTKTSGTAKIKIKKK